MYGLNRVLDVLIAPFQPVNDDPALLKSVTERDLAPVPPSDRSLPTMAVRILSRRGCWAARRSPASVRPGRRAGDRHRGRCGRLSSLLASNQWLPPRAGRHHEPVAHVSGTVTLWRPTGPEELALVEASGWREWPPRLPGQPVFYPVLNEEYAAKIARDWNAPALRRRIRHEIPGPAVVPGPVRGSPGREKDHPRILDPRRAQRYQLPDGRK